LELKSSFMSIWLHVLLFDVAVKFYSHGSGATKDVHVISYDDQVG